MPVIGEQHERTRLLAFFSLVIVLQIFVNASRDQAAAFQHIGTGHKRKRDAEWWVKPKSQHWKTTMLDDPLNYSDEDFRQTFRMHRSTFNVLLDLLQPYITGTITNFRKPIPAAIRLYVFLHHICHGSKPADLALIYGIGRSSISDIIVTVSDAICQRMGPMYIKWPSVTRMQQIAADFEGRWEIPQCVGCIDGSHIPIAPPDEVGREYRNRKCFYSLVLQGVVDPDKRFIDVNLGWPGKVNDGRVFHNSALSTELEDRLTQMNNRTVQVGETETESIPFYILGDSAYANTARMVTTYETGQCQNNRIIKKLNAKLAGMRYIVEHAFGDLKGRFRLLMIPMQTARKNVNRATKIMYSCVVLHNFLIDEKDIITVTADELEAMVRGYRAKYSESCCEDQTPAVSATSGHTTREKLYKYERWRQQTYDTARAVVRSRDTNR
jgi:hypothetical protein